MPLAASPQTTIPLFADVGAEGREQARVGGDREIGKIALDHGSQPLSLLINRRVPEPAERLLDLLELGSHSLSLRPAPELEAGAVPLAGAVVGKPQEVEHFRLALAPSHPAFGSKLAKLDEPGLCRVQAQREPRQTLLEIFQEVLRVPSMLEADDTVVGIADDDHVAGGMAPTPLLNPEIVDVVEVYVRKQR